LRSAYNYIALAIGGGTAAHTAQVVIARPRRRSVHYTRPTCHCGAVVLESSGDDGAGCFATPLLALQSFAFALNFARDAVVARILAIASDLFLSAPSAAVVQHCVNEAKPRSFQGSMSGQIIRAWFTMLAFESREVVLMKKPMVLRASPRIRLHKS